MIRLELTPDELTVGYTVALHQHRNAKQHGWRDAHGLPAQHGLGVNIVGALGELAIAKATGHPWQPRYEPDNGDPDVGPWHVRTTRYISGHLILHDTDHGPFILVIALLPSVFGIAGWIDAHDGKQPRYWRTDVRCPAYFIPQHVLTQDIANPA